MAELRRGMGLVKRATVEIPMSLYNKLLKKSQTTGRSINVLLSEQVHPWLEGLTVEEKD